MLINVENFLKGEKQCGKPSLKIYTIPSFVEFQLEKASKTRIFSSKKPKRKNIMRIIYDKKRRTEKCIFENANDRHTLNLCNSGRYKIIS